MSKLPKTDNTNTPLRALIHQQARENQTDEQSSANVNAKRGSQPSQRCVFPENTESIRQIIREELESVLETFKTSLMKEFDIKTQLVLDRVNQISYSLTEIEKQQEELKAEVKLNANNINILETENISLKTTIEDLNSRIGRMEQYSRANNLEIQNVPEHRAENLTTLVKQIATITNCTLVESDIQLCTRVAKATKDSQRPRSIIIKFSSQRLRDNFLAAALKFNKKAKSPTDKLNTSHLGIGGDKKPVFVVEHLSPAQKSLHAAARIKAKELHYKFIWVRGGRIFMRKTENSEYKLIKTTQDLSELI